MIRVTTFEEYDQKQLQKFLSGLFAAFGVGCEHSGTADYPQGLGEPYDADRLLRAAPAVRTFRDDKVLYLTQARLRSRKLPTGEAPTHGAALVKEARALVSIHPHRELEESLTLVLRHTMHQVGHLWDLHHCLDPRCAMYPQWTPSYEEGQASFCVYCQSKSDQKISLGNS